MLPERRLQVLHHIEHPGSLSLCGEIFGYIHSPTASGKDAVGHRHGTLPAGVSSPAGRPSPCRRNRTSLLEIVAQVRRGIVQVLRREVVTDILQRGVLHQVVGVGDRRFRRHDDRARNRRCPWLYSKRASRWRRKSSRTRPSPWGCTVPVCRAARVFDHDFSASFVSMFITHAGDFSSMSASGMPDRRKSLPQILLVGRCGSTRSRGRGSSRGRPS